MLKGIIFDFDGTLAETNTLILKAMSKTFMELFGAYTDEQLMACIGPPLIVTGRKLYPEDPQHLVDTYRKYQIELHDSMVAVYPGVIEMLEKLHGMNLKLAIVTSKKRDMLLKGLRKLEMEKYFDVLVAEDDVTQHKPDPEPMNLALSGMGLRATECIMVGDNYHDILAAHAVGMKSVAVGWTIKGLAALKAYNPDFIMHEAGHIFDIIDELR
jgi:pyrophosphatase PpaX